MSSRETYPKRLIEVDLPIKRISAHARREKYLGTITSLHLWWARRPLASCRAVICAALWPDPADDLCPPSFRDKARAEMLRWTTHERQGLLSATSRAGFEKARQKPALFDSSMALRHALLDFIADFANPDNSKDRKYLETSRKLTQAAHEALGGATGTRPLVVDPFAGGGSIPVEALRVGADAFASDLNPVPVLLNKVLVEYVPKYGKRLVDEVRKWGEWMEHEAEKELSEFFPKDADGATPAAYLWARTIRCEGPGCGSEVPLIRSLWLAKKASRSVALQLVTNGKARRLDLRVIVKQRGGWVDQANPKAKIGNPSFDGTVKRGSATCPCCGYTTPVSRVRKQLLGRHGGATDARLMCVVTVRSSEQGRFYRLPAEQDLSASTKAGEELKHREQFAVGPLTLVPNERISLNEIRRISVPLYGMVTWGDLFHHRQALTLSTLVSLLNRLNRELSATDPEMVRAIQTCLALTVSRESDHLNSACSWNPTGEKMQHLYARQALPMVWDFCETNIFGPSVGSWASTLACCLNGLETANCGVGTGTADQVQAQEHSLPDDSANGFVTDPPYYDAVPYAHLSDFFYVWLRRCLFHVHESLFRSEQVPKNAEIVVDRPHELSDSTHDIVFYERELSKAFTEGRRVLKPDGVGVIVFASKTTASWEAILNGLVDAGWTISGSWPIDTELETRIAAAGQARLASSVHIVCRPRENADGSARLDEIGDWRDVLQELPRRIHEWMPRLAEEGVVGADAIFACLGPALEVFSWYSRVEKASGEAVPLKEYLEQVWAAVAKEALTMIFAGADATGFEPDARLTAMWLWTLSTAGSTSNGSATEEPESGVEEEDENEAAKGRVAGFVLEYDAARKIAQGLGAHLEQLTSVIEVKGETARLLPVAERTRSLFQKVNAAAAPGRGRARKKSAQLSLV